MLAHSEGSYAQSERGAWKQIAGGRKPKDAIEEPVCAEDVRIEMLFLDLTGAGPVFPRTWHPISELEISPRSLRNGVSRRELVHGQSLEVRYSYQLCMFCYTENVQITGNHAGLV